MIIMNMPSIGLYRSRYKSRSKLRNRNFIAFLLAFLASFCLLFHLISFNNYYGFKSLATCLEGSTATTSTTLKQQQIAIKNQHDQINLRNEEVYNSFIDGGDGAGAGGVGSSIPYSGFRHDDIEMMANGIDEGQPSSSQISITSSSSSSTSVSSSSLLSSSSSSLSASSLELLYPTNTLVHFPRTRRRLPGCIIIGVRKGGTRALLEFLNLHPSVQKASDEVHFFDDNAKYSLGLTWYRKQMPYSFPDQVTIEKTPAYFITDSVPHRIHSMNSSIKLILIVRDPVTRLISDYAQLAENKAKRDRKMASFERMALQSNGAVNVAYKPVRTSLYSIYYSRWIQLFPAHQLHVVDGDRLVYDPYPEVQKAETFLGLEHKISRDNFIYNATKGFYCVRINGTLEKCLNESKGRPHPQVNPQVIRTLRRFYRPYNYQFYKMTGRNFDWPEI